MLPFQNLILPDRDKIFPIYKQITNRLISLIQEGTIQPGTYFPGTRQMAHLLNVNRKTVINAYEELLSQEWVETVPRKGYRVIPELPVIKPRSFQPKNHFIPAVSGDLKYTSLVSPVEAIKITSEDIVVNDGFPDVRLAPFKEISEVYHDPVSSKKIKQLMALRDEGGLELLRESTSIFLNETRGLNISKSDIIITRGAQMAIYIATMVLVKPGDNVIVSDPNYSFATEIMVNARANIITIPVDQEGIDVDQIEKVLEKQAVKLLYVVPHHHHPTTVTMSANRRLRLLQLIDQHNLFLMEDDYDYDFHYKNSPILPLASASHNGKIIYIGSFTKLIAPSVRVGYLIAAPEIVKKAIHLKRLIDLRGDTFMEYMLAQMIIKGDLSRHINKSNKLYAQRCDLICDLLTRKLSHAVEFTKPQGGMSVWLRFRDKYPINKVLADAARNGLLLIGTTFQKKGDVNDNGLRFGFASLSEEDMECAVNILSKITK
ncbi:PLP-dependent aminotransferase family protein [Pedobacter lithocola]|uniref:PLP-dependent aminotransferase family protein n=1 Tax=Pedobacter lithocola TaxID=1908239 RepID=A0ABV8PHJ9_9SPHI